MHQRLRAPPALNEGRPALPRGNLLLQPGVLIQLGLVLGDVLEQLSRDRHAGLQALHHRLAAVQRHEGDVLLGPAHDHRQAARRLLPNVDASGLQELNEDGEAVVLLDHPQQLRLRQAQVPQGEQQLDLDLQVAGPHEGGHLRRDAPLVLDAGLQHIAEVVHDVELVDLGEGGPGQGHVGDPAHRLVAHVEVVGRDQVLEFVDEADFEELVPVVLHRREVCDHGDGVALHGGVAVQGQVQQACDVDFTGDGLGVRLALGDVHQCPHGLQVQGELAKLCGLADTLQYLPIPGQVGVQYVPDGFHARQIADYGQRMEQ
mmetsp:Transcript_15545/g.27577  ORF Transcript_15545/g.27577 Transcript_15545/m.27577 type:complete len:316 (+) Transcript_15545:1232-2179(+)